jgi:hypothetical protein
MNRLLRIAILTFTAATVLVIASPQLQAQSKWPKHNPNVSSGQASQQSAESVPGALRKSYFTQGDYVNLYEEADQMLALDDPTTVVCPSRRGCVLEIEQSLSVGGVDSTGNWCGPFVEVDGIGNPAPPAGETPTDFSYIHTGSIWTTTLTPGKHTVQSFIYSYHGLYVWSYHNTYRVYVSGIPLIL